MKNGFTWLLMIGVVVLVYSFTIQPNYMGTEKSARVTASKEVFNVVDWLPYLGGMATLVGLTEKIYKFVVWIKRKLSRQI